MRRWIFALAAVLPLAGCGSYQEVVDNAWPFGTSEPATVTAQQIADSHCRTVAYARAADAKANGFDDDMREKIYNGTYANCASWDSAHPQIGSN